MCLQSRQCAVGEQRYVCLTASLRAAHSNTLPVTFEHYTCAFENWSRHAKMRASTFQVCRKPPIEVLSQSCPSPEAFRCRLPAPAIVQEAHQSLIETAPVQWILSRQLDYRPSTTLQLLLLRPDSASGLVMGRERLHNAHRLVPFKTTSSRHSPRAR